MIMFLTVVQVICGILLIAVGLLMATGTMNRLLLILI